MDFSAPHSGFVVAAYLISALVLTGLALAIWWRERRANAQLKSLEERGSRRRRRSTQPSGESA
ncbi:MAG: heme exporter protein CcmD [Hyphomicrobiales bacterium]